MGGAISEAVWVRRRSAGFWPLVAAGVTAFIFMYYWALLSDGKYLTMTTTRYGLVFNGMLEHMARGEFDVDPSLIGREGFTRGGRTYAYFGILPALLRWPLLVFPRYSMTDYTILSCAFAATIGAVAKLMAILRATRMVKDPPLGLYFPWLMGLAIVLGGPQVQFLRPSMYQEPIFWATAIAAVFLMMVFRWCVAPAERRSRHLIGMAMLAGLCLNTRVSTSLGLYAACGGIIAIQILGLFGYGAIERPRRPVSVVLGRIVAPGLVLIGFAAICGTINYERWGNPLTFQDYRYYDMVTADAPIHDLVRQYGLFNLERIPFALSYYFLPIWAIIRPDQQFLFQEMRDRLFYLVEPPPATFLFSDMFLVSLSVIGLVWLCRRRAPAVDRLSAWVVAASLAIPGALMLMAMAIAYRYRMEFYAGFEFVALFGLVSLSSKCLTPRSLIPRAAGLAVAVSIIAAHAGLLAYKVTPWGDDLPVAKLGWIASYKNYLTIAYPSLHRP